MGINSNKIPNHVAIIMDGNGRWAQNQGKDRSFGHNYSTQYLNQIIQKSCEIGVTHVSLFAFSTENWSRPASEVSIIFDIIEKGIYRELEKIINNGIKISVIGNISDLPDRCKNAICTIVEKTKTNSSLFLNLAINYSGKWEYLEAVKKVLLESKHPESQIDLENFCQEDLDKYMATGLIPDIDLLIRTGGELRLSNFMIHKLAYSELYFTNIMWPDFSVTDYENAISEYGKRSRRFGKI